MSRRHNNKSYNLYPGNLHYYPNYNTNYNNYNNYNTHSQPYYNNDNINYNTRGRFQKRFVNHRDDQNTFTNDTYQFRSFDNTPYKNNHNDYVNADHTNSNFSGPKQDIKRDSNIGQSEKNHATNSRYLHPEQRKDSNEIPSGSRYGTLCTEATENDNSPESPEIDINRPSTRTVLKKSLIEISKLPTDFKKQKTNPSYTDNFWKKGKDLEEPEEPCYVFHPGKQMKKKKKKPSVQAPIKLKKANQFEKRVNKMLSTPVEMSKGRSLLEKMGWKGGGLGKDEDGIIEPIAPKTIYASTTLGLGQLTVEDVEEREPVFVNRVQFSLLKYMLEFAKNYLESELKFEESLTNRERKWIHKMAEALRNGELDDIPDPYKSVMEEIDHHNDYLLVTESTGERQRRYLTLYKEAHDHMFVISPDDFEDEEEITDNKDTKKPEQVNKIIKKKFEKEEMNKASHTLDAFICHNNKTKTTETIIDSENKQIDNKQKHTNHLHNQVNNQIENKIKKDMEIIVIDCETEEANNVQIKVHSEESNKAKRLSDSLLVDDDTKNKTKNTEEEVKSHPMVEIINDSENKVVDNTLKCINNLHNKDNDPVENTIKNDMEIVVIDCETEESNKVKNEVNSEIKQEISNKTEHQVSNSEELNKAKRLWDALLVNNDIKNKTKSTVEGVKSHHIVETINDSENMVIDNKQNHTNNLPNHVNDDIENKIKNDLEIIEIDCGAEESNNVQKEINSEMKQEISNESENQVNISEELNKAKRLWDALLADNDVKNKTKCTVEGVKSYSIVGTIIDSENKVIDNKQKHTNNLHNQVTHHIENKIKNNMEVIVIDCETEGSNNIQNEVNSGLKQEISNETENQVNISEELNEAKRLWDALLADNDIKDKTKNTEESEETNSIEKIKDGSKNKVVNSKRIDINSVRNQVNAQKESDMEVIVIDSEAEDSNNTQKQVNSQVEKEAQSRKRELENKKGAKESEKKKNKKPKHVNDILDMIINYFKEFTEDPLYTEFRFLGPFDHTERCAINMFFDVCNKEHIIERSQEVLDLFDCDEYYLEVRLDKNGRCIVQKIEKCTEAAGTADA